MQVEIAKQQKNTNICYHCKVQNFFQLKFRLVGNIELLKEFKNANSPVEVEKEFRKRLLRQGQGLLMKASSQCYNVWIDLNVVKVLLNSTEIKSFASLLRLLTTYLTFPCCQKQPGILSGLNTVAVQGSTRLEWTLSIELLTRIFHHSMVICYKQPSSINSFIMPATETQRNMVIICYLQIKTLDFFHIL